MAYVERSHHDVYPSISPEHGLAEAAAGKAVLVTGAGQGGLGAAMALQFALAGASTIVLTGRKQDTLDASKKDIQEKVAATGGKVQLITIITDVTDQGSVDSLFAALSERGLRLNVLVNNSGVSANDQLVADSDPAKWWTDFDVTVKGTYLCTRAYLRSLGLSGTGADGGNATVSEPAIILNVSSGSSDVVSPTQSAYGSAKLAVNRFTEMVQFEYGSRGVRSISFSPGGVASTAMGSRAPPQFRDRLLDTPELSGAFAVWLSTEKAAFLAGKYCIANWDVDKLEEIKEDIVNNGLLVSRLKLGDKISQSLIGQDGKPIGLKSSSN